MPTLPPPHYSPGDEDPDWLKYAAQFHGHLGPWAMAGTRLGIAGRKAVDAAGYFDIEVTCEGPFDQPPRSCFLDGLQVATGATMGKRNLTWTRAEKVVVRFKNTRTGKTVVGRPTDKLLKLLTSFKPSPTATSEQAAGQDRQRDEATLESIARRIALLPDDEILTIEGS